jgi:phosphoglucosamine mutase
LPLLGIALARWALEKYGSDARFLLAQDTRYSGPWIKAGLMSGLLRYPITVYDAGILPTPGVFALLQEDSNACMGGIIISASHNPAEDNGIKLVDARSGKLSPFDEKRIVELMAMPHTESIFTALGKEVPFPQAKIVYRKYLARRWNVPFLAGKTIVLDCANGASSVIAPQLFRELGATVIAIHHDPDGFNINRNCGATSPESLRNAVVAHGAFIGFAFDGDADRVIAVNQKGEIKDGDDLLALLHSHPDYVHERAIVSTVMANYGLTVHFNSQEKKLLRSQVGDKHVLEMLDTENLLLGGEPSGHIILKNSIRTGDGMFVALKVLETILLTGNELLESFTKFPQVVINVPVAQKKDLATPPLSTFIAAYKEQFNGGRLLVRYSGTEPLVRVLVEGRDLEQVQHVAQTVAAELATLLAS